MKNEKLTISFLAVVFLAFMSVQPANADPLDIVEWDSTLVTLNDNLFFDVKETLGDIDCTETGNPILVTITSTRVGVGVIDSITLEAIEIDDPTPGLRFPTSGTCIFGNTELHIAPDNQRFPIDSSVTVTQHETNGGEETDNVITTKDITITSTADPVGITLTLTETGPNTGTFQNHLLFTSGASAANSAIHVDPGDIVTSDYLGNLSYSQILPSPNGSTSILVANVDDIITITYNGVSADALVCTCGGPGGGGGGFIRPGFVLDVIAAIGGGGGGVDMTPPSLILSKSQLTSLPLVGDIIGIILEADPFTPIPPMEDLPTEPPLTIDNNGYLLTQYANTIQTYSGNTDIPLQMALTLFDSSGIDHVALYTNLHGDEKEIDDSDTYIIYEKSKSLEVVDPEGFFSSVNFTISNEGTKYIVKYDLTFAKPMNTSNIIVRSWDEKRNSGDIKIFDAIKIDGKPIVEQIVENSVQSEKSNLQISFKTQEFVVPVPDIFGNMISYNSIGELEEKQVYYHAPFFYPQNVGKSERHDGGFKDAIIAEEAKAQLVANELIDDPFVISKGKLKNISFFYPDTIGKLDREDIDKIEIVMTHENVKAAKVFTKQYHTNFIED